MDHDEFFRVATLAICGSLRIEEGMRACIGAIRHLVPVDHMFLQIYEADLGAVRTIAKATARSAQQLDALTPMPPAVAELVRKNLPRIGGGGVELVSTESNPVAQEMLRFHGIEGSSVLRLNLMTEGGRLGDVIFAADGRDRYAEEHGERVALLLKPFSVALSNTLEHREVLRLRDRLADDNRYLHRELQRISGDEIVGADFGLKHVMRMVRQVAPTDSPVLLSGDTGVGKDVVANGIHLASKRRDGPFIAVNCGAIPDSLVDSELFGHERGAFTGALARKRGRFELAHEGTIFLDEIGEMPLPAQVRLLRVLQNREIERIGGTQRIPVDIRVIAATNKDLPERIRTGDFREDLWFRLNVFPIEIPPLRERPQDIPALVQHFVERKARELKLGHTPRLAEGAMDTLLDYAWPGNVRELENLVERAMILCQGGPLSFDPGGSAGRPNTAPVRPTKTTGGEDGAFLSLDDAAAVHIRRALERAGGRIHGAGGAGELLGINPNTLRGRMRKLGIPFKKPVS